jgi:carboxyl-terminal processing protease
VPGDSISSPLRTTIRKSLDNEYARVLLDRLGDGFRNQWKDRQVEFVRNYRLTDADYRGFLAFAEQRGVATVEQSPASGDSESVFVRADLDLARADLEARIKAFMARRLYGVDAFYPVIHSIDRTLVESMRLWPAAQGLAVNSRARN